MARSTQGKQVSGLYGRLLLIAAVVMGTALSSQATAARLDELSLDRWKKLREVERYQFKIAEKYYGEK